MSPARILIADSSPLVRERLASALVARIPEARIREASTSRGVGEVVSEFSPHVLLLDPCLPGDTLVELIKAVAGEDGLACRVLVLAWESSQYAAPCLAAGAHGLVDKAEPDLVIAAVQQALAAAADAALLRDRKGRAIA